MQTTHIALFKGKQIRKTLHNNEWWFSVVDVIQTLTDQSDDYTARKYWNKLAQRLREEGSEVVTSCHRLKLEAIDGKNMRQIVPIPKEFSALFSLFHPQKPSPSSAGSPRLVMNVSKKSKIRRWRPNALGCSIS